MELTSGKMLDYVKFLRKMTYSQLTCGGTTDIQMLNLVCGLYSERIGEDKAFDMLYDVSPETFAHAFDMRYIKINRKQLFLSFFNKFHERMGTTFEEISKYIEEKCVPLNEETFYRLIYNYEAHKNLFSIFMHLIS